MNTSFKTPHGYDPLFSHDTRMKTKRWLGVGRCCALAVLWLTAFSLRAEPQVEELGGAKFEHWTGLTPNAEGTEAKLPGEAAFRYPDGPRGFIKHGFRTLNDGTEDWRGFYGLRFDVRSDEKTELTATVRGADANDSGVAAKMAVEGKDWHTVTLPWTALDSPAARRSWLLMVKELQLAYFEKEHAGTASVRNVRLVRGPSASLECAVRGKAVAPGSAAEYAVTVGNATDAPAAVALSFSHYGWESMAATVEPMAVSLAPGETKTVTVRVTVPERIPAGGHEKQTLQAVANGDAASAATLDFITASAVPPPNILHTNARWDEVREKVKKYPWAKEAQDVIVQQAADWTVPEIAKPPKNDPDDTMGPFLFATGNEGGLMACGIAWQLTRDKAHAEKVAEFLRRLSDPAEGYPKTLRGCNQGLVQEGHFFQHIAMAYDMIAATRAC